MQRHRNDSRAETQRFAPHDIRQQTLDVLRQIRLSFQQQHGLSQRTFIDPGRTCSREHQLLTLAASLLIRRAALQTNPFLILENPCFTPTRLTRNPEPPTLDTFSADYADLWICKREDRIVNTREVHTKNKRPPRIEEAANYLTPKPNLIFVVAQQPALLQVLAAHTVSRPRHRVKTLVRHRLTTVNTLAITRIFDTFKRFID